MDNICAMVKVVAGDRRPPTFNRNPYNIIMGSI